MEFNAATTPPTPEQAREALDAVRPGLIADGGNVELVEVEEDGTVLVALQGACKGCPASRRTLELVIEPALKQRLPGVAAVLAV